MKQNYFSATRIAAIALFAALAGVLYILHVPAFPIFASWLELNFSDVPAFIGTFALGPVAGCIIVVIKILIKLLFVGTKTGFIGELADLLIGLALVLPAGLIYKKDRTLKGAMIAMVVGSLASVLMGVIANWQILIPYYAGVMGGMPTLVGALKSVAPECTEENFFYYYLLFSVVPFNLIRCAIAVIVTLPIYKRVSKAIKAISDKFDKK